MGFGRHELSAVQEAMRRRAFLGMVAGTALIPFSGSFAATKPKVITLAALGEIAGKLQPAAMVADDAYIAFLHPDCWRDIRTYEARGRWLDAWHKYRDARRHGLQEELDPRQVLERFGWPVAKPITGELGSIDSVRFIKSAELPKEARVLPTREIPGYRAILRNKWER